MSRLRRWPLATFSVASRRRAPARAPDRWRTRGLAAACLASAMVAGWTWHRWTSRTPAEPPLSLAAAELPSPPTAPAPSALPIEQTPPAAPAPTPAEVSPAAPAREEFQPRPPRDTFEAQIALTRDAICPGSIDGIAGSQTRNAFVAFQQKHGLRVTGMLDNDTRAALMLREPPLTTYTVTEADITRLRPWPKGWEEKSKIDRLDYSTVLELVAEQHYAHPDKVKQLNPQITDWENIPVGTTLAVPRVRRAPPTTHPALIVIHLSRKTLQIFDANSRLLAHFPCSIARRVEKRPVGRVDIITTAPNPNYTFDPDNFPDSAEAQAVGRKLILQPGPNNPVGVAFIKLNLPGYGIHGSPEPEKIGRTESAGCFRLSNWNAQYLLPLVYPGLPIQVEP